MKPFFLISLTIFAGLPLFARNANCPQYDKLNFLQNIGQVIDQHGKPRNDIQYKLSAKGVNVFLGAGTIHYEFFTTKAEKTGTYRIDISLAGANKYARPLAANETPYYESYHLPGCNGTAHAYNKITYKDIYPGIDWVLYIKDAQLEYDFIVHPGGDINDIKIKYAGNTSLILKDNMLNVSLPLGTLSEGELHTYIAETGQSLSSRYVIHGNTVGFKVDAGLTYKKQTIVIDPKVLWGTYYGGNADENIINANIGMNIAFSSALKCDKWGNTYIAGTTNGSTNMATTGSYESSFPGGNNCIFFAKFNASGARLWASYFGGSKGIALTGAAIDTTGNLYLTGNVADTAAISLSGGLMDTISGNNDAFLVKFDSSGRYNWGTYYGDNSIVTGSPDSLASTFSTSVACDAAGNVYLYGNTNCNKNIATKGSSLDTIYGYDDAFLVKFDAYGKRIWGTYVYAPSGVSNANITIDKYNHIFLSGFVQDNASVDTGIGTPGTYQPYYAGKNGTSFILMYDTTGKKKWGSFIGNDTFQAINMELAPDQHGNMYATGYINSNPYRKDPFFPSGSFLPVAKNFTNCFLIKLDSTGKFKWGTFYADSTFANGGAIAYSVACDTSGAPTIVGVTFKADNIATAETIASFTGGYTNGFVAKFSTDGERMWGSYFGGSGTTPLSVSYDQGNNLYITGATNSDTLIATSGAFQPVKDTVHIHGMTGPEGDPSYYLNYDAFLVKVANDTAVYIAQPFTGTILCSKSGFTVPYKTNYLFRTGNTFTVQLSDDTGSFVSPVSIGSVTAVGTSGSISCALPAGARLGGHYRIRIVADEPHFISSDNARDIYIDTTLPPSITITASAFAAGLADTFIAHIVNGGPAPTCNWYINNRPASSVPGAYIAGNMLVSSALGNGDVIKAVVYSNSPCAAPDSASASLFPLDVSNITANENAAIYPNPSDGQITIQSVGTESISSVIINDELGKTIFEKRNINNTKAIFDISKYPAGLYYMAVKYVAGDNQVFKIVKK